MAEPTSRFRNPLLILALIVIVAAGGWFAGNRMSASNPAAAMSKNDRAAVEQVVREYILTHPEILPEAMDNLRLQETAKRLAGVRAPAETPFPGAILGNPQGKITLVEFSDYACGYCRKSVEDVDALIKAHPDLRIVMRELPILSPESADAARMALAAAEQGKYDAFHRAMFLAGRPSPQTIEAAARVAGLDMERARRIIADPRIDGELKHNVELARQLGFDGTPSWIVGDKTLSGAVGVDALADAIKDVRG